MLRHACGTLRRCRVLSRDHDYDDDHDGRDDNNDHHDNEYDDHIDNVGSAYPERRYYHFACRRWDALHVARER